MEIHPLDEQATASSLRELAHSGHLSQPALERALILIGQIPSADRWRSLLNIALLALGASFMVSGIVFFFAYNWVDLPAFFKFGLIEAAILLCVGLATYLKLDTLAGKTALMVAAVLVGILQAVYGQVYQTGADSYQLFLGWAILVFGWVLVSRHAPLWFLLLILLNLGVGAYLSMGLRSNVELETVLFVLNATALFVWEYARQRGIAWLSARWPMRLIACAAFLAVVMLMFEFLSGYPFTDTASPALLPFAPVVYFGFAGIVLFLYSRAISDLFILTITAFSLVVVITAGLLRFTFNSSSELGGAFSALYIGGAIVVQMAVAFYWLQKVARSKERSQ